jgi:hypothetical protein
MKCTRCHQQIKRGQPYHRTRKGPHHWDCSTPFPNENIPAGSIAVQRLESVKESLVQAEAIAKAGCVLAATVILNIERGQIKDDEFQTLHKLASNVILKNQERERKCKN